MLIFVLVFSLVLPAYAQDESDEAAEEERVEAETEEEIIDLGALYVESTRLEFEEAADRPASFATVLNPIELNRRALTLADALDATPGVSVRSFGGLGALSTISIRGTGSENVLVLLDGIPLNPTGGSVDLSDIPLGSLERIEIIRGGEGAFVGAGASGGVVRLRSVQPDEDGEDRQASRFSVGSFGTVTGGYTWRGDGDLLHFELAGSRGDFPFLNDNGTAFDLDDDFTDARENNEFSSIEARYGHSWDLDGERTLGFSAEWYRGEKGIPGITTFPSTQASQTDGRFFLHTLYADPGFYNGELTASLGYLRQARNFADPLGESTGVPLFTSWIHNRWDAKTEWSGVGWGKEDVLTCGASVSLEALDAGEYSSPNRNTVSAWVRDEWYHPSGAVLIGAVRGDWLDGDATLSPRGGLRFPLDEEWALRTNLGLDFRPPSFEELYRNEGVVIGNPGLTDERTLGFDIGVAHTSERIRFEAAYFNLQTKDLIDYLLISGFRWKPYNIGRVRSSGFEVSADWILDRDWEFRGSYTRTRAIDASGDSTRQGQPLVGQPSSELFAHLRWHDDRWEFFIEWERRGPSPITPSGTRSLPANESTALGIGYKLDTGSSLLFEIRNLFDESLTDVRGFPLPGRSIFVTWSAER